MREAWLHCRKVPQRERNVALHMRRCEGERAPLKVALLLSGGVDSSLALKLLLAAGHHVIAFYLQVFTHLWAPLYTWQLMHLPACMHQ